MDTAQEGPKEGPFSITFKALHLSSQSHHHFATQDMFPYNWVLNFTSKNYPWSRLFGVFVPSSEFFQQHARPSVIQKKKPPGQRCRKRSLPPSAGQLLRHVHTELVASKRNVWQSLQQQVGDVSPGWEMWYWCMMKRMPCKYWDWRCSHEI
jgi:hypothetical protein